MTKQVQRRRGTDTQHTSFTGAEGEISVNTTNKSIHVHDGATAGGVEAARADLGNVSDADLNSALSGNTLSSLTVTSADINGGTIDGTVIGGTTPAAGSFTTGSFTGDVTFGDNDKAIFGAGSDLQIYHDGSNSLIKDSGTGHIKILANDFRLQNVTESAAMIAADQGGAVTAYYNGAAKLATTSTGVDVTGTITSDGLSVAGTSNLAANVSNTTDTAAYHGLKINTANTSSLTYPLYVRSNNLDRLVVKGNGDINFYEDTGTTPKFFWDASAESLGIGTTSPDSLAGLEVYGKRLYVDAGDDFALRLEKNSVVGGYIGAPALSNLAFYSSGGSEAMRIDSSGNVGIGTDSPTGRLDITNSSGEQLRVINTGAGSSAALFQNSTSGTGSNNGLYLGVSAGINYLWTYEDQPIVLATDNLERMRIDSSGNVGIGTSSPWANSKLQVRVGADQNIGFNSSTGNPRISAFNDAVSASLDLNFNGATLRYETGGTERMRIDSSGNLLVGKTGTTFSDVGAVVRSTGSATITRDGGDPLALNRKTSDGEILGFYKDGSTVGSIGSSASGQYLHIGSDDVGLTFAPNVDSIIPFNVGTGAYNANVDLGYASGTKFRNIYLNSGVYVDGGGGVYLGGTGSANKLDDYETGTWTPTLLGYSGVGYSNQDGYYTKVGRLVVAHFRIGISSIGTYAGNSRLGGLPFSAGTNITNIVGNAPNRITALNQTRDHQYLAIYNGGSDMFCYTKTGGALNYNIWQAGEIEGVITYFTS